MTFYQPRIAKKMKSVLLNFERHNSNFKSRLEYEH